LLKGSEKPRTALAGKPHAPALHTPVEVAATAVLGVKGVQLAWQTHTPLVAHLADGPPAYQAGTPGPFPFQP
jgi:hypothetical protein